MTHQFKFQAGRLCLDFINTVDDRPGYLSNQPGSPAEFLKEVSDLNSWGSQAETNFASLESSCGGLRESKLESKKVLSQAIELRELLFKMFLAAALHRPASKKVIDDLNTFRSRLPMKVLTQNGNRLQLTWPAGLSYFDRLFGEIIVDAEELLKSTELERLKVCGGEDCGWLFIDTSKNGKRRWCDMAECGNRDKAKRFYTRKRAAVLQAS